MKSFLLLAVVIAVHHQVGFVEAAIGDSRLRIAITNSLPSFLSDSNSGSDDDNNKRQQDASSIITSFVPSSAMHHGATARLYDPLNDFTYHRSSDPRLIEVLGKMWNPRKHPDKCGALYREQLFTTSTTPISLLSYKANKPVLQRRDTFICDPEHVLQPEQANEIDRIVHSVPLTTGCQCDALRHCNQYSSGFTVYVAVVPFVLEKPQKQTLSNIRNVKAKLAKSAGLAATTQHHQPSESSSTTTAVTTSTLVQKAFGIGGAFKRLLSSQLALPIVDVKPNDLIISREMRGIHRDIVPPDASIYDLLALYLRASWATGECDEDMVICLFPKEKKFSLSVGGRLFAKMTSKCLNTLVADTLIKLSSTSSKEVLHHDASLTQLPSFFNYSSKITESKKLKESQLLTNIFQEFIINLNTLIQSRQDDPCSTLTSTTWSNIDILGFAAMTGLGLSISVLIFLRLCGICLYWVDRVIEQPKRIGTMFRQRAKQMQASMVIAVDNNEETRHHHQHRNKFVVCDDDADIVQEDDQQSSNLTKERDTPSISIVDTPDAGLLLQAGGGDDAIIEPDIDDKIAEDSQLVVRRKNSVIYVGNDNSFCAENIYETVKTNQNDTVKLLQEHNEETYLAATKTTANGIQCEIDSLDDSVRTERIVIAQNTTQNIMLVKHSSQRPTAV